jgi:hypothetical protein
MLIYAVLFALNKEVSQWRVTGFHITSRYVKFTNGSKKTTWIIFGTDTKPRVWEVILTSVALSVWEAFDVTFARMGPAART